MHKPTLFAAVALLCLGTLQAQKTDHSFLEPKDVPNSVRVLNAPPTEGDPRFEYDKARYFWGRALRNTPRGKMAFEDCDCSTDGMCRAFSGAMGVMLNKEATPELVRLIAFVNDDAGWWGTDDAKNHYMRVRPFVYFSEHTCNPTDEPELAKNGSYPSGHTAGGYGIALVLAEINTANQDTILRRGMAIGDSRVICGFHWQSDVDAGMLVAAGVVARLHADEGFRRQLERAKDEFAALQAKGLVKHVEVEQPQAKRP